jgi:bacterioferritin-associated ferredoxin
MIVCHCRAVSDRAIRAEIELGAAREDELTERCGAGGHCGGCLPALQRLLAQHDCPSATEHAPAPVPA